MPDFKYTLIGYQPESNRFGPFDRPISLKLGNLSPQEALARQDELVCCYSPEDSKIIRHEDGRSDTVISWEQFFIDLRKLKSS